eukprot:scaffold489_cov309-Pavlova_lutheri.AAC.5
MEGSADRTRDVPASIRKARPAHVRAPQRRVHAGHADAPGAPPRTQARTTHLSRAFETFHVRLSNVLGTMDRPCGRLLRRCARHAAAVPLRLPRPRRFGRSTERRRVRGVDRRHLEQRIFHLRRVEGADGSMLGGGVRGRGALGHGHLPRRRGTARGTLPTHARGAREGPTKLRSSHGHGAKMGIHDWRGGTLLLGIPRTALHHLWIRRRALITMPLQLAVGYALRNTASPYLAALAIVTGPNAVGHVIGPLLAGLGYSFAQWKAKKKEGKTYESTDRPANESSA